MTLHFKNIVTILQFTCVEMATYNLISNEYFNTYRIHKFSIENQLHGLAPPLQYCIGDFEPFEIYYFLLFIMFTNDSELLLYGKYVLIVYLSNL